MAIFGSLPAFGGAFSMDNATLTFTISGAGDGGLGFLVQSVQAQYARPVQRVFELGPSKATYYVTGRPEGQMSIARLAAPAPVNAVFLEKFSKVCNVEDNNIVLAVKPGADCPGGTIAGKPVQASRWKFSNCLISAIAFQIAVDQIALTENLTLVFTGMEQTNT